MQAILTPAEGTLASAVDSQYYHQTSHSMKEGYYFPYIGLEDSL